MKNILAIIRNFLPVSFAQLLISTLTFAASSVLTPAGLNIIDLSVAMDFLWKDLDGTIKATGNQF